MACLSFNITHICQTQIAVTVVVACMAEVNTAEQAALSVRPTQTAAVSVGTVTPTSLTAVPIQQAKITVVLEEQHVPVHDTTLVVEPISAAALSVSPTAEPHISVLAAEGASVHANPTPQPSLSVAHEQQLAISVSNMQKTALTVGEVCSVCGGILTVLAASDGPLLTRSGGYILLDPDTNPPEQAEE